MRGLGDHPTMQVTRLLFGQKAREGHVAESARQEVRSPSADWQGILPTDDGPAKCQDSQAKGSPLMITPISPHAQFFQVLCLPIYVGFWSSRLSINFSTLAGFQHGPSADKGIARGCFSPSDWWGVLHLLRREQPPIHIPLLQHTLLERNRYVMTSAQETLHAELAVLRRKIMQLMRQNEELVRSNVQLRRSNKQLLAADTLSGATTQMNADAKPGAIGAKSSKYVCK